jgi:hypothetical protein
MPLMTSNIMSLLKTMNTTITKALGSLAEWINVHYEPHRTKTLLNFLKWGKAVENFQKGRAIAQVVSH